MNGELRYRADGDALIVECGNEVAALDVDAALGLALVALEVALRKRGAAERVAYWIERVTDEYLSEQLQVRRSVT